MQSYAIRLTLGTHPDSPYATPLVKRYVRYGASPRAAQALVLAAKIQALNRGQAFVSADDIRAVALPALRHRLLLNFEGEADEVSTDTIVKELLARRRAIGLERLMPLRFQDDFLKKLEYLHVVSRREFAGQNRADRRTPKRGRGIEFADHRPYTPGDDFRHIDWKAYKPAEPAAAAAVRRRAGPADLPDPRRQRARWRSRRSSTWRGGSRRRCATSVSRTSIA